MFWPAKRTRGDAGLTAPNLGEFETPRGRFRVEPSVRQAGSAAGVEVGVLVDATGSGQEFSDGVTLATRVILTEVERRVGRLSVWVQTHRDEDYDEFPNVIRQDADANAASAAVAAVRYKGGGDASETHLSAFESAFLRFDERQSRPAGGRVMLVFINADTKPARSGRSPEAIGMEARELGLLVYLVCEPTPALGAFCEAAGGMMVPITNTPSEELMMSVADRIARSVTYSVSVRSVTPLEAPASLR